jgi:hypothetical protein
VRNAELIGRFHINVGKGKLDTRQDGNLYCQLSKG